MTKSVEAKLEAARRKRMDACLVLEQANDDYITELEDANRSSRVAWLVSEKLRQVRELLTELDKAGL